MLKVIFFLSFVALATCFIGTFETVDVDEEEVISAATHAVKGLSKQFAGSYHHKLYKILKAERQVLSGVNYKMDIIVGMTDCKKDEVDSSQLALCAFKKGISTYKKCTVVVHRDYEGNNGLVSTGCILADRNDL